MNFAILALEGCMPSAVAGISDVLTIANWAIAGQGGKTRFRCRTLSLDGRDVPTVRRQRIAVDGAIGSGPPPDVVIVPGFLIEPASVAGRLPQFAKAMAWLRRRHAAGAVLGAFCTGVFVLAEAGLLDGRRATTTWWLQSELKARHPRIDLALDAVVTECDRLVCAAGPMSWLDLTLTLIETTTGAKTARLCADFAVLDTGRRSQAAYVPRGYLLRRDPWLVRAEMLVRRGGTGLTVQNLAAALKVSQRTLHRRISALAGEPPQPFIAHIRMNMARTLLETTRQTVKEVAHAVGYEDESSFRKAFRKRLAASPGNYRVQRRLRASVNAA